MAGAPARRVAARHLALGALEDTPDLVNSSALEDGWFIKVKMSDAGEVDALMDAAAYAEHTKE